MERIPDVGVRKYVTSPGPEARRLIAEIGAESRHHPGSARIPTLRRELHAAYLAQQAREVVAEAPKLTPERLAELRQILAPVMVDERRAS